MRKARPKEPTGDLNKRWGGVAYLYECEPGGDLPPFVVVTSSGNYHIIYEADANGQRPFDDEWHVCHVAVGSGSPEKVLRTAGYEVSQPQPFWTKLDAV